MFSRFSCQEYGNKIEIQNEWQKTQACVYLSVTPQNRFTHFKSQEIPIKLLSKQYPVVTYLKCLFKNMPKIFMPRT